jgi:hypothetical protein
LAEQFFYLLIKVTRDTLSKTNSSINRILSNLTNSLKLSEHFFYSTSNLLNSGSFKHGLDWDLFEKLIMFFSVLKLRLNVGVRVELNNDTEAITLFQNLENHLNFFRSQLVLNEAETLLHLSPKIYFLHRGARRDLMLKLSYFPDVLEPVSYISFKTLFKSIIAHKILELAYFANCLSFTCGFDTLFYIRINSKLNTWNRKVLTTLSQVHL